MLLMNNLAGVLPCTRRSLDSANTLEGAISKHHAEESQGDRRASQHWPKGREEAHVSR